MRVKEQHSDIVMKVMFVGTEDGFADSFMLSPGKKESSGAIAHPGNVLDLVQVCSRFCQQSQLNHLSAGADGALLTFVQRQQKRCAAHPFL